MQIILLHTTLVRATSGYRSDEREMMLFYGGYYGACSFARRESRSFQLESVVANFRCLRETMCCVIG